MKVCKILNDTKGILFDLTATVETVLSQEEVVTTVSFDFGSICNISTSGSLMRAAINVCACFVASDDPLKMARQVEWLQFTSRIRLQTATRMNETIEHVLDSNDSFALTFALFLYFDMRSRCASNSIYITSTSPNDPTNSIWWDRYFLRTEW